MREFLSEYTSTVGYSLTKNGPVIGEQASQDEHLQSAISSISWLVCQPKRFDLGKSGSSPATDYSAANSQTTQTQEQG
jgi:hypothetical protein